MLLDAKKFWAEAISTATYLKNRSPTSKLEDMTPGMERNLVWSISGCSGALHSKGPTYDSKAKKCILVGYGSVRKGYRLYDQAARQVLYMFSRNVKFLEEEPTELISEDNAGREAPPVQSVLELKDQRLIKKAPPFKFNPEGPLEKEDRDNFSRWRERPSRANIIWRSQKLTRE